MRSTSGSQSRAARRGFAAVLLDETPLRRWWIISLGVIVVDHATKWLIQAYLPYGSSIPFTGFFNLVHVWNTGAAFSFLADESGWQRYLFIALAAGVSVTLAWMLRSALPRYEALAFSVIIGGAVANAIDRLIRGHVVDFLDFHWRDWHWPAFNAADIALTFGAALIIAGVFFGRRSAAPSADDLKR